MQNIRLSYFKKLQWSKIGGLVNDERFFNNLDDKHLSAIPFDSFCSDIRPKVKSGFNEKVQAFMPSMCKENDHDGNDDVSNQSDDDDIDNYDIEDEDLEDFKTQRRRRLFRQH